MEDIKRLRGDLKPMTEILIEIKMDSEGNIEISNNVSDKKFVINFIEKKIKASDIYNMLDYCVDNNYSVKSNIDCISDERKKAYFLEVFTLIDNIKDSINEVNIQANATKDQQNLEQQDSDQEMYDEWEEEETENELPTSFDDWF